MHHHQTHSEKNKVPDWEHSFLSLVWQMENKQSQSARFTFRTLLRQRGRWDGIKRLKRESWLAHNRVHREERVEKEEEPAVSVVALRGRVWQNSGWNCFLKKGAFIAKADIKHWLFCFHPATWTWQTSKLSFPFSSRSLCHTYAAFRRLYRSNNLLTFLSSADVRSSSINLSAPELHRVITLPASSPWSVTLEALNSTHLNSVSAYRSS